MKELLPVIEDWTSQNKEFAIATVIKTWGSAPRPIGSSMIVSSDMEMAGSVSGGCVEGAVIKSALPLIENKVAKKLAYGVADEEAWAVGLSCGGKIQVFAERFLAFDERPEEKAVWENLKDCLSNNKACVLMTRIADGASHHLLVLPDGTFFGKKPEGALVQEGLRAYKERKNQVVEYEDTHYFAQVFPRKSQMLIIGAAHITVDLVELAKMYDFETIVIDPRGIFSSKTQFTSPPDKIFADYPAEVLPDYTLDAYTYAVVLSHDPKIDDNALHLLLPSDTAYIGALGSRRTHAKRVKRLEEAGFSEEQIARIHAPIGVDINAKTPKEIALSIMGEIIKVKNEFL
jgi:xanthine dehydrogenase accessory factor